MVSGSEMDHSPGKFGAIETSSFGVDESPGGDGEAPPEENESSSSSGL